MREGIIQKIKFDTIRKKWDQKEEKWYFSVVDIIGLTVETSDPRNYWKVLKNRLKTKQNQLVTKCNQLKLQAPDSKFYLTDVGDINTITSILEKLSPQNILHFKAWALGLTKPKLIENVSVSNKKILTDIGTSPKEKSYPQITYTLADLIQKKSPDLVSNTERKKFKKVTKMRTI